MKILIAGIGNVFFGDDGFGVEVIRCLSEYRLPEDVTLMDVGIRSFDLLYALQDAYDFTILVDATARGGKPGTVYLIEPDLTNLQSKGAEPSIETHNMNPLSILQLAKAMGADLKRIFIIGCEPAHREPEMEQGLSQPVSEGLNESVSLVLELIEHIRMNELDQHA